VSIIVPPEQKLEHLYILLNSPPKQFHKNLYKGLSSYMQTHTKKHSEAKRHTVTIFHYKYAKKNIGSVMEMLRGIIISGGTTEVYTKPP